MAHLRLALALSWLVSVAAAVTAHAEGVGAVVAEAGAPAPSAPPAAGASASAADTAASKDAPAASASASTPTTEAGTGSSSASEGDTPTIAGVPMVEAAKQEVRDVHYGMAVRARWASVPKWLLGLFLDQSKSLSSYTVGIEGFRRRGTFDISLGVAWQALSPPDGNWLGRGKTAATETDYVQFKNFGSVSIDVALMSRTELNPYVFLHYGGGIGIGITTGKMLRTSAGTPGCTTSPGDVTKCYPIVADCPTGPCSESALANSEGGTDGPQNGSRFVSHDIPSVYPIVNLITGLDFKIPGAGGLELKVDLGYFFPYFFLGAGAGYQF
jgi:hypothetical protein